MIDDLPRALDPLPYGPFAGLICRGYNVILADPPWPFLVWSSFGEGRSASQHYPTMSLEEIIALPVELLAGRDSFLFLWTVNPQPPSVAERVMNAWGFRYSGVAFTWVKLNPSRQGYHRGLGYGTRQNTERVLLGRRGSPRRLKGVDELVIAPRRDHSRKPDDVRQRIGQFAPGPFIELFARERAPGWASWGQEVGKYDEAAE